MVENMVVEEVKHKHSGQLDKSYSTIPHVSYTLYMMARLHEVQPLLINDIYDCFMGKRRCVLLLKQ